MQEYSTWEWAEGTSSGKLSKEEESLLNERLAADPAFAQEYNECLLMLKGLNEAGRTKRFKAMLHDIHEAKEEMRATRIIKMPYFRTAAVAAGIALVTSLATVWAIQHSAPKTVVAQNVQLLRLKQDIESIKQSQNVQQQQIETIKVGQESTPTLPSNYSGTGFALTNDGYIITSYHVTEGADSIYVQTNTGKNYKAHIVAFEPKSDVAVLKIEKEGFHFGKGDLPYTFAVSKALLGARIYSLGFPQDEIVYNEGYIASRNGYQGDSTQYRLEIAAGPGQSGAPVADEQGNIIAIIKSKDLVAEGTTYAVTSKALLRLLHDLPKNMKLNLPHTNHLAGLPREAQIEELQNYTCVVKVYGK